jgi:GT2 family glycosyltransferase
VAAVNVPSAADLSDARVRLIVLNYNGGELLLRCFSALGALEWPSELLELVCVDNGSTDGSIDTLARDFPQVEIRRQGHNGGFPANNRALEDLEGVDFVGLVNNDAFVEPGWLAPLVEAMQADPGLGAVSSKMVLAPRFAEVVIESPGFRPGGGDDRELGVMVRSVAVGSEDVSPDAHLGVGGWGKEVDGDGPFEWAAPHAVLRVPCPTDGEARFTASLVLQAREPVMVTVDGGTGPVTVEVGPRPEAVSVTVASAGYDVLNNVGSIVFEDGAGADRGWLERDLGQCDQPTEVFAWCGGSVLFRPEYLHDVGLFDERFFLYYEDTDLSWRGRARGWRYRTVPTSVARHVHAASSGEGSEVFAYHVERNRLLMLVKNAPWRLAARQVWRYALVTASYGRRDIVRPALAGRRPNATVTRRRTVSFVGFLRLLPAMLGDRRAIRRRQLVDDDDLIRWLVER